MNTRRRRRRCAPSQPQPPQISHALSSNRIRLMLLLRLLCFCFNMISCTCSSNKLEASHFQEAATTDNDYNKKSLLLRRRRRQQQQEKRQYQHQQRRRKNVESITTRTPPATTNSYQWEFPNKYWEITPPAMTTTTTTTTTNNNNNIINEDTIVMDASLSSSTTPMPEITFVGNDEDTTTTVLLLKRCEGDCDNDDDCEDDLICYQRERDDPIPGCSGVDSSRNDFCVLPSSISTTTITATAVTTISSGGSNSNNDMDDEQRQEENDDDDNATTTLFVTQCLNTLQENAINEKVNRDLYVDFLEELSKGSLSAQQFQDLPLFLSMIFFSASCSQGEDCVTEEPAISVSPYTTVSSNNNNNDNNNLRAIQHLQPRQQPDEKNVNMNYVLCHQLMRYPFLEVLFPFQFLIRVSSNDVSASELMMLANSESSENTNNDDNRQQDERQQEQIIPNIESALDQVLLRGFNCSYTPGEPYQQKPKQMIRGKRRPITNGKFRQPQPQNDCDFVVEVTIADAADYPCGFRDNCILVFSDVSVYAVLNDGLDEPLIRRTTTEILRSAINGNALEDYL